MRSQQSYTRRKLVEYDGLRHRLWIRGQRCHHGAAGTVVAALACLGIVVDRADAGTLTLAAAGGALMLHDWKDRSIWFERGAGSQP